VAVARATFRRFSSRSTSSCRSSVRSHPRRRGTGCRSAGIRAWHRRETGSVWRRWGRRLGEISGEPTAGGRSRRRHAGDAVGGGRERGVQPRRRAVAEVVPRQRPRAGEDATQSRGRQRATEPRHSTRRAGDRRHVHWRSHRQIRLVVCRHPGAVAMSGPRRIGEHRISSRASARHRGRDAFALERVHHPPGTRRREPTPARGRHPRSPSR